MVDCRSWPNTGLSLKNCPNQSLIFSELATLKWLSWVIFCSVILSSCSSVLTEKEIGFIPLYRNDHFQYIPNETLNYEVHAGLLRVGEVKIWVEPELQQIHQKTCVQIKAEAASRKGLAFISKIRHNWSAWIDTGSGRTLKMDRSVVENGYFADQVVNFFPDSNLITQQANHKEGKPISRFRSQPDQMYDLMNVIWQFRYTNFEKKGVGDTLQYLAFFDGQWLWFKVRYGGTKPIKSGKKKLMAHRLQILGIHSQYLRGENPVEVLLETSLGRKPLLIKISSYLGSLEVRLKSGI